MNNKITEKPTKTDREEEPELEQKNPNPILMTTQNNTKGICLFC